MAFGEKSTPFVRPEDVLLRAGLAERLIRDIEKIGADIGTIQSNLAEAEADPAAGIQVGELEDSKRARQRELQASYAIFRVMNFDDVYNQQEVA